MDTPKKSPTVLSFCAGYGGIELGLERVFGKISVLAHVEIEAYADANLINKMENLSMVPSPVWTDLKTFRPRIFRGCVDILTGGYPCQPFSNAGRRKGTKDPRHIWPWIRSAIKVIQPEYCFFENVEGHVSLGLREVLTDLVKLGYRVENDCGQPTWGLFSAAEVGAPHQRKRVFILACRKDIGCGGEQAWEYCSGEVWTYKMQRQIQDGCSIERCCELENSGRGRSWRVTGKAGCKSGPEILRQGDWPECSVRFESTGSDKKLVYPGLQRQKISEQQAAGIEQSDKKLWNPESDNERRPSIATMHRERIKAEGSGCGVGLAYTCCKGSQGTGYPVQERRVQPCPLHPYRGTGTLWPARPGELQHEWEEPRTVVDGKRGGCIKRGQCVELGGIQSNWSDLSSKSPESSRGREAKPQLGRATHGTSCRVDRLRLLGNGVVPQTSERAFRVLFERIVNPDENYVAPSVQLELFGGGL